jgi:acetyl esterase/lipase
MAWQLDHEVAEALAPFAAAMAENTPPPAGDVEGRRVAVQGLMTALFAGLPEVDDVKVASHRIPGYEGAQIEARVFTKDGAEPGPLAVYLHGGGMILGSLDLYTPLISNLCSRSGVTIVAPEYRLAPEFPHPTPVEDCYAGLVWAAEHAAELGCDPARIGVAGDSAGGGLAAGVALLARDRGAPALARQILIYPMLDDRNTVLPDPAPSPLIWSYDDNITGWGALLGDAMGGADVSPYAAPARATDVSGLAPAYIMVGDMDIFRDEDITYAARMTAAGVPVEFHLVPGGPHGFDFIAPNSEISRRAFGDEVRALRSL